MRRLVAVVLVLFVFITLFGCQPKPASEDNNSVSADESITITVVSAWSDNQEDDVASLKMFHKIVSEESNGKINIRLAGGPESISPFELGSAVSSGAIDAAMIEPSYYVEDFPECGLWSYSDLTAEEERESSVWDYFNKKHQEKMNVTPIFRNSRAKSAIYSLKPIRTTGDFKGLRMRSSPGHLPFLQLLEATTVPMPAGDIYTSIERGVIEAYPFASAGIDQMMLLK